MEPIGLVKRGQIWLIKHRCLVCRQERLNKVAPDDVEDEMLSLG